MSDEQTNLHELKEKVKKFCEERDWDQYHNAKAHTGIRREKVRGNSDQNVK